MSNLQQINLYSEEFAPANEPLRVIHLAVILALVLVLFAVTSLLTWHTNYNLQQQESRLESELSLLEQSLEQFKTGQDSSNGGRIDLEIEQLKNQVGQRQKIKSLIDDQNLGNSQGFSELLTAMAENTSANMSLQSFSFHNGGNYMEMSGWVRTAGEVPRYIQALQAAPAFSATNFGVLTVSREERATDPLRFTIAEPSIDQEPSERVFLPAGLVRMFGKEAK